MFQQQQQSKKDEILEALKNSILMNKYAQRKRQMQKEQPNTLDKINSGIQTTQDVAKGAEKIGNIIDTAKTAKTVTDTGAVGSGIASSTLSSALPKGADALSFTSKAGDVAGQAGKLSKFGGAMGKAAPAIGGITNGLDAANNFQKGDYINGTADAAQAVLAFVPGWGQVISMGIEGAQQIFNAQQKEKQKANQKSMAEAQKAQQLSEQATENAENDAEQTRLDNLQNMQDALAVQNNTPTEGQVTGGASGIEQPGTFKENTLYGLGLNELEKNLPIDLSFIGKPVSASVLNSVDGLLGTKLEDTFGHLAPDARLLDFSPINRRNSSGEVVNQPILQGGISQTSNNIKMPENYFADIINRFKHGYNENVNQTFNPANLTNDNYERENLAKENLINQLASNNITDEATVNNALQGLNGGNSLVDEIISKAGIIKPQGEDQIQMARKGGFNQYNPEVVDKNGWDRLGEALGTGQRLLANPMLQGAIASAIYKATGGDTGESIAYGIDWMRNKSASDYYGKKINPNGKPQIFGQNYTADDYNNVLKEQKNASDIELAKIHNILKQQKQEHDIKMATNKDEREAQKLSYDKAKVNADINRSNAMAKYYSEGGRKTTKENWWENNNAREKYQLLQTIIDEGNPDKIADAKEMALAMEEEYGVKPGTFTKMFGDIN